MGLFDNKKKKGKDDFDSPMESIDLNQVAPAAPAPAAVAAPSPAALGQAAASHAPAHAPGAAAAPERAPRSAPPPPPPSADSDSYGIDKAIELMRTLPSENIQLVVQVVKFSLESVGIKLPIIIEDAIQRQKDLRGRVDVLKAEISDLESEISQRKSEIEKHEADFRETSTVRERLELAEGLNKPKVEATGQRSTGTMPPLNASAPNAPVLPPPKK